MGLFWVALISLAGLVRAQDADESVYVSTRTEIFEGQSDPVKDFLD